MHVAYPLNDSPHMGMDFSGAATKPWLRSFLQGRERERERERARERERERKEEGKLPVDEAGWGDERRKSTGGFQGNDAPTPPQPHPFTQYETCQ